MSSEQPPKESTGSSRRDFIKLTWGALGAIAAVEVGAVALGFSLPRTAEGEFGSVFLCGAVDDFPPGSVTPFNLGRFFLVRLPDGGFLALYRKCTHLGCSVPWDQTVEQFVCPCHASAFDMTGDVLNPPAPRPLDLFALSIEGNQVFVNTSEVVERDHFSESQVRYVER
jgi:cytochrome b6-f complex iron-sulfur subunit